VTSQDKQVAPRRHTCLTGGLDAAWRDLVGPQLAAVTRPEVVLFDGTLRVHITDPSWSNALRRMTQPLEARLTTRTGGFVRELQWVG
jgi:predicted nucleic acid-binding Zn ribbon protein